jgi:hypothetical protein
MRAERGLFILDENGFRIVDRLPTRGLALRGKSLFRVIGPADDPGASDDLLVYDEAGIKRTSRLDGLSVTRCIAPHGDRLAAGAGDGAVYDVGDDGAIERLWPPAGSPATVRINGLAASGDEVYATTSSGDSGGAFVRLGANETLVDGLADPHDVVPFEDGWLICDTAAHDVGFYDARGARRRGLRLEGPARGLTTDERYAYVGEHPERSGSSSGRAVLTVIDLRSWEILDRRELELRAIHGLMVVPRSLAAGVRIGSRTNSTRVQQNDQLAMFERAGFEPSRLFATGDPFRTSSLRVRIHARIPHEIVVGETVELACRIENRSDAIVVTAPPNPTKLCYRWFDERGAPVGAGEWIHTALPRSIAPADSVDAVIRVAAPRAVGRYTLAVTLLQENVIWFDDIHPGNGMRGDVEVVHAALSATG